MPTFFAPKVRLISRPQLVWHSVHNFLDEDSEGDEWEHDEAPQDGEALCEFMGRMCYGSFGKRQGRKSNQAYIENILDHSHGSVLEHANYSFLTTRAGRGYTHQHVRHRAGCAFSQESSHFIEYGIAEPRLCLTAIPHASAHPAAESILASVMAYRRVLSDIRVQLEDEGVYCDSLTKRKKASCGAARALLPNALESKLGFTANLRALRHFCELRGGEENTVEIRHVAAQVCAIMRDEAPNTFRDLVPGTGSDGYPVVTLVTPGHKKV